MKQLFHIQDYLTSAIENYPNKIAVTDGKQSLSYADLDFLSGRIASGLSKLGAIPGKDKILLLSERSPRSVAAIIGVLRSGCAYIPVDPKSPLERLGKILSDCEPSVLITDGRTLKYAEAALARSGLSVPLLILSERQELGDLADVPGLTLNELDGPEGYEKCIPGEEGLIAYIIYTSGSTGMPKGVMVTHDNVSHYIDWFTDYLNVQSDDRILSTAPFHFDMSIFDIFAALKTAATLCIAPDNALLFPLLLVRFIEEQKVTVWKGVSSLLVHMCKIRVVQPDKMPTLKKILFAGERLATPFLRKWMETYPDKKFYNAYGPTETTGVSICHRVANIPTSDSERVPIGVPRRDTTFLVLDESGFEVPPLETGELYIGGPGVAAGYLNDPEKTEYSFVSHPFIKGSRERFYRTGDYVRVLDNGNLEFVGRADGQIKIMGYRIELGEIEDCLHSLNGVHEACVIIVEDDKDSSTELVAFVEAPGLHSEDVVHMLEGGLPQYMRPRHVHMVETLPRCTRGKVSRQELKEQFMQSRDL